jgi:hypothetical protein
MDPGKNLFYCYGCGRGGDVIRFAELYHQLRFPQAVARLLHTLFYRDEIRALDEFRTDTEWVTPQELELARLLVESLAAHFEPANYKDNYRESVRALIDSKIRGEELKLEDGQDGRVHIEFYGKAAANPLVRLAWTDAQGKHHKQERNLPSTLTRRVCFKPRRRSREMSKNTASHTPPRRSR